MYTKCTFRIYK